MVQCRDESRDYRSAAGSKEWCSEKVTGATSERPTSTPLWLGETSGPRREQNQQSTEAGQDHRCHWVRGWVSNRVMEKGTDATSGLRWEQSRQSTEAVQVQDRRRCCCCYCLPRQNSIHHRHFHRHHYHDRCDRRMTGPRMRVRRQRICGRRPWWSRQRIESGPWRYYCCCLS
jgi:hypothetical protein